MRSTSDALEGALEAVMGNESLSRSWAAAMSEKLCGTQMKLEFDDMNAANPTCHCECPASECLKETCPPGFRLHEGKCKRLELKHHEGRDAVHEKLECLEGQRDSPAGGALPPGGTTDTPGGGPPGGPDDPSGEGRAPGGGTADTPGGGPGGGPSGDPDDPSGGGRAPGGAGAPLTCYYDCDCPKAFLGTHHHLSGCQCTYQVECETPMERKVVDGEDWCIYEGVPARTETTTEYSDTIQQCPAGFEMEEGEEEGDDDECAKYVEVEVPAVPPRLEPLECPDGMQLEVCGGKVRCFEEVDCPEVETKGGSRVRDCAAALIMDCGPSMELELNADAGVAHCKSAGVPAHTVTRREAVEPDEVCPDGYYPEGGEQDCARHEHVHIEEIPAQKEPLQCHEGTTSALEVHHVVARRRMAQDELSCYRDCECPEGADQDSGLSVDNCECKYTVGCEEPMTIVVENGERWCHFEGEAPRDEQIVKEAPVTYLCPDGATYNRRAGKCELQLSKCPPTLSIHLDQKAMACGPKTDEYITHMFNEIYHESMLAANAGFTHNLFTTCSIGCISTYAKFSECAWQNDPATCVGRAGKSGHAIRAIGHLSKHDTCVGPNYAKLRWLRKAPACKAARPPKGGDMRKVTESPWMRKALNFLPCKDMYGSEVNFMANWEGAVKNIENIAKSYFIKLSGDYVSKPTGRIDCRKAHCGKTETNSKNHGERTLASCVRTCSERFGGKR